MFAKHRTMIEAAAERGARMAFVEIQQGLKLQVVDVLTGPRQVQHVPMPSSLGISVLLSGEVDLRCGRHRFHVDAGGGRSLSVPQVSLFRVGQAIEITRHVDENIRVRHLSLQATPDWLERSGVSSYVDAAPVFEGTSSLPAWKPSGRIVATCEQLLRDSGPDTALARLRRESQVLDIVNQVLTAFGGGPQRFTLSTRRLHRLRDVREQLEAATGIPTVEQLARMAGMSVDTLQRQFRAAFGTTVFGYLQEHRLQCSYRALEAGSPVSSAAYAAGYSSPANFSTAFKRRFGVSPKHVRRA